MDKHIFFAPDIASRPELPEDESLHCAKVLRLSEGTEILIADGKGSFYVARITRAHHKRCAVDILEKMPAEKNAGFEIEIAMAPTKNLDRIEWFAEKATEIGIDGITFLRCRYSERKELKEERIQKILISAMKQSVKAVLPKLETMVEFSDFVKRPFDGEKYIAHCYPDQPRRLFSQEKLAGKKIRILIGPEGDFSEEEVALAIQYGYQPISLGTSRLRTETAALVACHTAHVLNNL